jgi:ATP-binding cassette subfamily B protein
VLEIISGVGHSSKATASVSRVMDMLDEPIHDAGVMQKSEDHDSGELLRGALEFESVCFAYDDATQVLHDISFTIRPGERIAITGPSGSGKSTAINLLPRFLAPSKGTIRVGGRDTEDLPLPTLRSGISIAFQEVFLFNATIDENLRYARPDATRAEVERACKITGAHEVIERLPKGYETRLSDYGVELSRGEKQRITLARALLKNAPILILDEATASIDRESSRALVKTIFEEVQNRTIIMVTHEATLLDLVDHVICIRDGEVDFDGSPDAYIRREFGTRGAAYIDEDQVIIPEEQATSQPSGYIEPSESKDKRTGSGRFDAISEPASVRDQSQPSSEERPGT